MEWLEVNEVKQVGNYRQDSTWDNPQTGRVYSPDGLSPTLNTCGGGDREVKIIKPVYGIYTGVSDEFQRGPLEDVSRCLKANNHDASVILQEPVISNTLTTVQKDNLVLEPNRYRIRKLTPLECWRLMNFTDEDFHKAEAVNSNTQLYKQAGNSIVKAVLMAIFRQMMPGGTP